jgi:uncharacterized YigZ family protein
MTKKDFYYTIAKKERTEIKIKGSRFIATASYVHTKEEALAFLESIRKEFYNATHNCFAWRIGADGLEFRASDDGEPNGSAGKPILFVINKFDYSDIIVIVTRYFGGTKLGVGGLARAYSDATEAVLELCERKPIHVTIPVKVFCSYEDISIIKSLISQYALSYEELYHDAAEFTANVAQSKTEEFCAQVTTQTKGRAGTVIQQY